MFAKLLLAAITLQALLVKADPTPIVPGQYMRLAGGHERTLMVGFDAQVQVIHTSKEETVRLSGVQTPLDNGRICKLSSRLGTTLLWFPS